MQESREESPGVGAFDPDNVLGRPFRHDAPTAGAAFGAKINHPIGFGDQIKVVFDDDH